MKTTENEKRLSTKQLATKKMYGLKNIDYFDEDEVEVEEEVTLAVGGEEESEAEHTRAALVDFVYSRLGKK
jgi:hypothetical protein